MVAVLPWTKARWAFPSELDILSFWNIVANCGTASPFLNLLFRQNYIRYGKRNRAVKRAEAEKPSQTLYTYIRLKQNAATKNCLGHLFYLQLESYLSLRFCRSVH